MAVAAQPLALAGLLLVELVEFPVAAPELVVAVPELAAGLALSPSRTA